LYPGAAAARATPLHARQEATNAAPTKVSTESRSEELFMSKPLARTV
jgi:hypothetical protein